MAYDLQAGSYINDLNTNFERVDLFTSEFCDLLSPHLLPQDRLLVETDCPYLSPDPYRGKTNEPSRVSLVAKKLAEIHSIPIERITEITSNNATEIFQLSDL